MANELTVTMRLQYTKGNVTKDTGSKTFKVDVSGASVIDHVQTIATTPGTGLILGDVAEGGWCQITNLDDTNYVEVYGVSGDTATIKILAGESVTFRTSASATLHAIANSAAVDIQVTAFDA